MKLFIVVILAAICGLAVCGKVIDEYGMQCAQKHNVETEIMKDVIHGKVNDANVTRDMKCFSLCIAEKTKVIKDGVLQPQFLTEYLPNPDDKELAVKITNECNLKGTDDCDTAFKIISCIAKNKIKKM